MVPIFSSVIVKPFIVRSAPQRGETSDMVGYNQETVFVSKIRSGFLEPPIRGVERKFF